MIVGTAGHVDHGKTALVKALTGIDTDRLPEEKRRGITVELGFAHMALPSGRVVGVVDVPGHERFVKAMAAGAGGVDIALLVIAADEGVMPQTREHLDICRWLGVQRGLVVVTKSDLLPGLGDEWRAMLEADVAALVADTPFESSPVFVCAPRGDGLAELKLALDVLVKAVPARPAEGPLFIPIDRAFTVKGFGVVVTGTVWSGRLELGQSVGLAPGVNETLKVRGLQRHGVAVPQVDAGERVAANLAGLDLAHVARGQALVLPGQLGPTQSLDVELSLHGRAAALPRRARRLVTLGTEQREARVHLLQTTPLQPGETCFAQLRFAAPIAAAPGLRFIMRGYGGTVAGGRVLALDAPRRRVRDVEALANFAAADGPARVPWLLQQAGAAGLTLEALVARAAVPLKVVTRYLEKVAAQGQVVLVDKEARRYVSAAVIEALAERAVKILEGFHRAQPEAPGLSLEALRQQLGNCPERTFGRLVARLGERHYVERVNDVMHLSGKGGIRTQEVAAQETKAQEILVLAGLAPPIVSDLATSIGVSEARLHEVLRPAVTAGRLVKADALYFASIAIEGLEAKVRSHFERSERLTTQEFKELTQLSRKFLIPLAELLDARKVTLRVGDARVLRGRK